MCIRDSAKAIENELSRNELDVAGNTVTFHKIELFGGKDGQVVAGVYASFKSAGDFFATQGWVYLLGQPSFDEDTGEAKIVNVDYDVNTKNFLVDSITWAASPVFCQHVEKELHFEVLAEIKKLKDSVNAKIGNLEITKGVKLNGLVENLAVEGIYVGGKHLTVMAKCTGKARIETKLDAE